MGPDYPDAFSPDNALSTFELREEFQIEVFASEPIVMDPVEMVFAEWGPTYVIEMPDYPDKPALGQGKSRVVAIWDTNGDGRADQRSVFADGLPDATSALPWDGGLIVTAAPNIWYFKDTNGDGKADVQEVLFTGFFENNSEAQITNLRFSVDNWIYASNFGQAGSITSTRNPSVHPLDVTGGDFRFRMDNGAFEVAAGPAQFGQGIDDWGERFVSHNTTHISHLVIPWRYVHRHPYLPDASVIINISDHDLRMYQRTPAPYWRAERTRRRQKRYDEAGNGRIEYAANHFTGSSGGTVYDASLFPEAFYGNVFTGDVAGNLIHRDVLVPKAGSPTFVAQRAADESDREFLASVDSWFRPASFSVGPDGALYVVDMYRQHIETPLSIPEDLKADMDFYNGSEMGRIYRIFPKGVVPGSANLDFENATTEMLVNVLSHSDGWWRRTAQRLLLERQDIAAIPMLRALFETSSLPQARLHALYGLDGLNALSNRDLRRALADMEAGVRIHGIRLAEGNAMFFNQIAALTNDDLPRVALQAILSLGSMGDERSLPVFITFMAKHLNDRWMRRAVLSSEIGSSLTFLEALHEEVRLEVDGEGGRAEFLTSFAEIIAKRNASGEFEKLKAMFPGLQVEAPMTSNTP